MLGEMALPPVPLGGGLSWQCQQASAAFLRLGEVGWQIPGKPRTEILLLDMSSLDHLIKKLLRATWCGGDFLSSLGGWKQPSPSGQQTEGGGAAHGLPAASFPDQRKQLPWTSIVPFGHAPVRLPSVCCHTGEPLRRPASQSPWGLQRPQKTPWEQPALEADGPAPHLHLPPPLSPGLAAPGQLQKSPWEPIGCH